MLFLAIMLPWVYFLIHGQFAQAACALVLQFSIIGWIPAAIWAAKAHKKATATAAAATQ